MNRERLELLIDVLSNVPIPRFDMGTWGLHNKCGTVACALGWAALDPRMNEQGLMLFYATQDGDYPYMQQMDVEQIAALPIDTEYDVFLPGVVDEGTPLLPRLTGLFAATSFFDITMDTAHDVFTSKGYPVGGQDIKPIDVINKIEDLLQHGEHGPEDEDEDEDEEDEDED